MQSLLKRHAAAQKWIACLCAAPIALKSVGLFHGLPLTSHPSVKHELDNVYDYQETAVVLSEKLITA